MCSAGNDKKILGHFGGFRKISSVKTEKPRKRSTGNAANRHFCRETVPFLGGQKWVGHFGRFGLPKGPARTVFGTESGSIVFYYSVVNLLRILIHYSKYSKSVLKM